MKAQDTHEMAGERSVMVDLRWDGGAPARSDRFPDRVPDADPRPDRDQSRGHGSDAGSSGRQRRAIRRAALRARQRAVLAAALPAAQPRHKHCVVDGCEEAVRIVHLGPLELALCPDHKSALDREWAASETPRSALG